MQANLVLKIVDGDTAAQVTIGEHTHKDIAIINHSGCAIPLTAHFDGCVAQSRFPAHSRDRIASSMILSTVRSWAPSLPPGWNTRKSDDVNPRASISATASTSPRTNCKVDDDVGARSFGQASRTRGKARQIFAALEAVLSVDAVAVINVMPKRLQ
jgi:hypothetical protein